MHPAASGFLLVLRNPGGTHIVPGGRIETGETFHETLKRELLEETGWAISEPVLLGFVHFHHLNPRPPGYPYPHPDFIQLMYRAEAVEHSEGAKVSGDYEREAKFQDVKAVAGLGIPGTQRLYLDAALKVR